MTLYVRSPGLEQQAAIDVFWLKVRLLGERHYCGQQRSPTPLPATRPRHAVVPDTLPSLVVHNGLHKRTFIISNSPQSCADTIGEPADCV